MTDRLRQRTIRRPVIAAGPGIHSGEPAEVTCRPASVGTGIVFRRAEYPGAPPVRSAPDEVTDTRRGVTLGRGASTVRTVEHLLAAAVGLGISNLIVDVRGDEIPILDGSAAPFCALLRDAGVDEQDAVQEPLVPSGPIWVGSGDAALLAVPAPVLRITYVVPLRHATLGPALAADVTLTGDAFVREVAPARTWGFIDEIESLRSEGRARGASLENALAIGPAGFLNPPRMADEPARHKILDLMGDLALLGRPLHAHVLAVGAGHALHVDLVRGILGG